MKKTQKPIYISPLDYKGQKRIKISFDGFDREAYNTVQKIEGFRYSKTYKCYHLPYNTQTYKQLKQLFDKIIINNRQENGTEATGVVSPHNTCVQVSKIPDTAGAEVISTPNNNLTVEEHYNTGKQKHNIRAWFVSRFYVKVVLPFNAEHIVFLKTLQNITFDKEKKCWFFAANSKNIDKFQNYFKVEIKNFNKTFENKNVDKNDKIPTDGIVLLPVDKKNNKLFVIIPYNRICIELIKKIKNRKYIRENKCWIVDNSKVIIEQIVTIFTSAGYKV